MPETINTAIIEKPHLDLIRITARLEEAKVYIQKTPATGSYNERVQKAVEERWFGFVSEYMTHKLMASFDKRFFAFPTELNVLKQWLTKGINHRDFKLLCNFHIQLSDPYYRLITGDYIPTRRERGFLDVPVDVITDDAKAFIATDVNTRTRRNVCGKALTAARDCGLLKGKTNKDICIPEVSLNVLAYILYSLNEQGITLTTPFNLPYIRSIYPDSYTFTRHLGRGESEGLWKVYSQAEGSINLTYKSITTWYEEEAA